MNTKIIEQGSNRWDVELFDKHGRLCDYINGFTSFDEAREQARLELRSQFYKATVVNEYGQEALVLISN